MNTHLGRTLAKLRKEKKVSQRETAKQLGVSQALLSHYENGLREPGLGFLYKAADHFACSTDFLLGRTLDKQGISLVLDMPGEEALESDGDKNGRTRKVRLLANGYAMLAELLEKSGDAVLFEDGTDYLALTLCRLFRRLAKNSAARETSLSALSPERMDAAAVALASALEFSIAERLYQDSKLLTFDGEKMVDAYPVRWESMLTLIKETDEELGSFVTQLEKKK